MYVPNANIHAALGMHIAALDHASHLDRYPDRRVSYTYLVH